MISVVIPTYNRIDILLKCLKALENQTISKDKYEVIVVDDGSTDSTKSTIEKNLSNYPYRLLYFHQSNRGPASARNIGIREAKNDIILFIGDDIIASPNLLEEHLKSHTQYSSENAVILGYTTWSPDITITPFMYWLEHGGPQFSYDQIENQVEITQHQEFYFYTSNLSLKRCFTLKDKLFDEDFPYAAFEDTEYGYRLRKKGVKLIYNKKAIGYHYHPMNLESVSQRMQLVGQSMVILFKKQPEIIPIMDWIMPKYNLKARLKELLCGIFFPISSKFNIKKIMYGYYSSVIAKHLWRGYRKAQQR